MRADAGGVGRDLEVVRNRVADKAGGGDGLAVEEAGDGAVLPLHAPEAEFLGREVAGVHDHGRGGR